MAQAPCSDSQFRILFDAHHAAIRDYCHRRLSPADANDATAEVFLVAWRRFDALPGEEAALPWLYGVARNVVRTIERTDRRSEHLRARLAGTRPTGTTDLPDRHILREVERQAVVNALDRLRSDDRELLLLHAWENLDTEQLSVVFGIKPHAAEMRLHRAVERLRRAYEVAEFSSHAVERGQS